MFDRPISSVPALGISFPMCIDERIKLQFTLKISLQSGGFPLYCTVVLVKVRPNQRLDYDQHSRPPSTRLSAEYRGEF